MPELPRNVSLRDAMKRQEGDVMVYAWLGSHACGGRRCDGAGGGRVRRRRGGSMTAQTGRGSGQDRDGDRWWLFRADEHGDCRRLSRPWRRLPPVRWATPANSWQGTLEMRLNVGARREGTKSAVASIVEADDAVAHFDQVSLLPSPSGIWRLTTTSQDLFRAARPSSRSV